MAAGMVEHVLRVLGINDCRAMGEQDDLRPDLSGEGEVLLASRGGLKEGGRTRVAGRPTSGDAGVKDEDIRRRRLHEPHRVFAVESIADGEKVEVTRRPQHRKLVLVA